MRRSIKSVTVDSVTGNTRSQSVTVWEFRETGKANTDSKDGGDRTPLSYAAGRGHKIVVKMLLETGEADADSKGKDDRTPLL